MGSRQLLKPALSLEKPTLFTICNENLKTLSIITSRNITMNNTITYLTTSEIDHDKALLLIDASIQAYNAFNKDNPTKCDSGNVKHPKGYELVGSWTGVDAVFNEVKKIECYGVVFRTKQAPYTYIFAFRGTDGIEDLVDDFGFDHTPFIAYKNDAVIPSDVAVESGFYHIYSDSDSDTTSMQEQAFALIDQYQASEQPIHQLYITGHSLGCTLSTLFTLDLALSRPDIKVSNYNYASPRVGNQAFVNFYEQQPPQQDPETRTVRIQNVYDKVPCTPLEDQGYQHLPYAYLIAFYRDNLTGKFDIVDNHFFGNYQTTLECAFSSATGLCEKVFEYDQNKKMKSVEPDSASICKYW